MVLQCRVTLVIGASDGCMKSQVFDYIAYGEEVLILLKQTRFFAGASFSGF